MQVKEFDISVMICTSVAVDSATNSIVSHIVILFVGVWRGCGVEGWHEGRV